MQKQTETQLKAKDIQLVVFRVQNEEFGAEINSVLEISRMLDITRIPESSGPVEGVINLRGQVIPVLDIARQFGLNRETAVMSKAARIVIVEVKGERVGLMVDEVPEVLRISEEAIEPVPELTQSKIHRDTIKGVAKIAERLILVVDVKKMGDFLK